MLQYEIFQTPSLVFGYSLLKCIFVQIYVHINPLDMITTQISTFRQKIKTYVDLVLSSNEPLLINRGDQGVVLVSLEEYNSLAKTASILSSKMGTKVAEPIEKQEFVEVDIDSL